MRCALASVIVFFLFLFTQMMVVYALTVKSWGNNDPALPVTVNRITLNNLGEVYA